MKFIFQNLIFAFILLIIGILTHNQIIDDPVSIASTILTILLFVVFVSLKKESKEKNKEFKKLFN